MMALSRHFGKQNRGLQIYQITSFDEIRQFPSTFLVIFIHTYYENRRIAVQHQTAKLSMYLNILPPTLPVVVILRRCPNRAGMQRYLPGMGSHFQWLATARLPGPPACLFNSSRHMSSCVLTLGTPQSPVAGGFTV